MLKLLKDRWQNYNFILEELVKRDFKKRYKRTVLGILWSMLGPLLEIFIMALVFTQFFGRTVPHFVVYVFSGRMIYQFYKESTSMGMQSLVADKLIITKLKMPKYLFLFLMHWCLYLQSCLQF